MTARTRTTRNPDTRKDAQPRKTQTSFQEASQWAGKLRRQAKSSGQRNSAARLSRGRFAQSCANVAEWRQPGE